MYQTNEQNNNANPVSFSVYNPPADDIYAAAVAYVEKNLPVIVAQTKALDPKAALVFGSYRMNTEQDTTGSRGWLVACVTRYEPKFATL